MKFIIEYGCDGIGSEWLAVEAESLEEAEHYAYLSAFDYRDSYEGLHGVQSFAEFCEENELNEDSDESWEEYNTMIEEEIFYHAYEFNEEDELHLEVLEESEGKFFVV